jgi:hypothetical protein
LPERKPPVIPVTPKKAVKPIRSAKTKGKKAGRHRADRQDQIPDFYLTPTPLQEGRASIEIANIDLELGRGKTKARAQINVPGAHIGRFTGLIVGLTATTGPVLALGIACYASLPVHAVITVTAIAGGVALLALALLFYMLHKQQEPH